MKKVFTNQRHVQLKIIKANNYEFKQDKICFITHIFIASYLPQLKEAYFANKFVFV